MVLTCISLITCISLYNLYLLATCISSQEKCLFKSFVCFFEELLIFTFRLGWVFVAAHRLSLVMSLGFSLGWLLLLWSKDSRHTGLVAPQFVGSSWTRDRTHVPCIARHILNHWTTREVPFVHFLIKLSAFLLMSCKHSLHILEARHFIRYCKSGLQICSPFCCFSFLNST